MRPAIFALLGLLAVSAAGCGAVGTTVDVAGTVASTAVGATAEAAETTVEVAAP